MVHSCEEFTAAVVADLRNLTMSGACANNAHPSREVGFSWDEEQGSAELRLTSTRDDLLSLDMTVRRAPRWVVMSIGLGQGKFSLGDTLSIVLEADAADPFNAEVMIRSRVGGETWDTPLRDQIRLTAARSVSVCMHQVEACDALALDKGTHTLLIGLPKSGSKAVFYDFGFFVTPAHEGQTPPPVRLASYG